MFRVIHDYLFWLVFIAANVRAAIRRSAGKIRGILERMGSRCQNSFRADRREA